MTNQPQEKEWAGTLLYMEKLLAASLCTTVLESANEQVRNHATGILNKCLQDQKALFDFMNKKGWYKVESAPQEQFSRTQQSFSTLQTHVQQMQ